MSTVEATSIEPLAASEPEANKLFRMVMKHEGSDLHLKVGQPPMMRLKGDIRRAEMKPLTQEDMERLMYPLLNQRQRRILDRRSQRRLALRLLRLVRARCHQQRQQQRGEPQIQLHPPSPFSSSCPAGCK